MTRNTVVCLDCQQVMQRERSGAVVLVEADFGPYQLYYADLFDCGGCHKKVVSGFAHSPFAEHFQPDFADRMARAEIIARVR